MDMCPHHRGDEGEEEEEVDQPEAEVGDVEVLKLLLRRSDQR